MSDAKPSPSAPNNADRGGLPAWLYALVASAVILIVGFALYSGGSLQQISVGGLLNVVMQPKQAPPPTAPAVFTPNFIVGKWQVDQTVGQFSGGTTLVYRADGSVEGWAMNFVNNSGQRESWQGTWSAKKVSDTEFAMDALVNGQPHHAVFRIFDHDHIQNENDNYVAERIP